MKPQRSKVSESILNDPIVPTMIRLTIPMLFAIASMMLVPLTDAYFVGKLGLNELAAIGFTLPITGVIINIALGTGMAISAIASRLVGENKHSELTRLISDGYIVTFFLSCLTAFIIYVFLEPLFSILGATPEVFSVIKRYMGIWLLGAPIFMFSIIFSGTCRALGDTKASANISLSATILNIILDPILIFGLGPIPAFGVEGAALASVVSFFVSFTMGLYLLYVREKVVSFNLPDIKTFTANFSRLSKIGVNTITANLITPLSGAVMTAIIALQGTSAVAGFGVGVRIEMLALLVILGFSSTLPMFVGQNLGAGKPERCKEAVIKAILFCMAFQLIIFIALALSAPYLATNFTKDKVAMETLTTFLYIMPIGYGFLGITVLAVVCLNVLGKPTTALALTLTRLFLLGVPLAWLGSLFWGTHGFFTGLVVGNILSGAISFNVIYKALQKIQHRAEKSLPANS